MKKTLKMREELAEKLDDLDKHAIKLFLNFQQITGGRKRTTLLIFLENIPQQNFLDKMMKRNITMESYIIPELQNYIHLKVVDI